LAPESIKIALDIEGQLNYHLQDFYRDLVVNFVSEDAAMPKKVLILITALATFYILGPFTNGQEAENSTDVSEAAEENSQVIQVVNDTFQPGPAMDDTGHVDRTIDAESSHGKGIEEESADHGSEVGPILLGLIIILFAAKLGGDLVERFKQPAVLGELIFGMIIGNLTLIGIDILEPLHRDPGGNRRYYIVIRSWIGIQSQGDAFGGIDFIFRGPHRSGRPLLPGMGCLRHVLSPGIHIHPYFYWRYVNRYVRGDYRQGVKRHRENPNQRIEDCSGSGRHR
jgi:hypothetical protein